MPMLSMASLRWRGNGDDVAADGDGVAVAMPMLPMARWRGDDGVAMTLLPMAIAMAMSMAIAIPLLPMARWR